MLVCVFYSHVLHTRPRVQRAPGFPCALVSEDVNRRKARAHRAARMQRCICSTPIGCLQVESEPHSVIARSACDEAIHLSTSTAVKWIASRSLSSGAHSRDPVARNDVDRPEALAPSSGPVVRMEPLRNPGHRIIHPGLRHRTARRADPLALSGLRRNSSLHADLLLTHSRLIVIRSVLNLV